jgi:hypothetical protein
VRVGKKRLFVGQLMGLLQTYPLSFKNPLNLFLLCPGEPETDSTVRTELAGDRNKLYDKALLFDQLLGADGEMGGRKKDYPQGHL